MPERDSSEFQRASWLSCSRFSCGQEPTEAARQASGPQLRWPQPSQLTYQQAIWDLASFRHSTPALLRASDKTSLRFYSCVKTR